MDMPDLEGLSYNPETGIFTWEEHRFINLIGQRAGRKNINGYRQIAFKSKRYYEHRLAFIFMVGRWPVEDTDHMNHIRDDNRWSNLREASRTQNNYNLSLTHNKLGLKGVYQDQNGKYVAQIRINGPQIILGRFNTPEEAKEAYDLKSKELHKNFYFNPQNKE